MIFITSLLKHNKGSLEHLDLRIQHIVSIKYEKILLEVFKGLYTLEKIQIGLIRQVAQCRELKSLTIPVFCYTGNVML